MISAMGDLEGKGKGGFVLLDEDFKVKRTRLSLILDHDCMQACIYT